MKIGTFMKNHYDLLVKTYHQSVDPSSFYDTLERWEEKNKISKEEKQELETMVDKLAPGLEEVIKGTAMHSVVGKIFLGAISRPAYTLCMNVHYRMKKDNRKSTHNFGVGLRSAIPFVGTLLGYPYSVRGYHPKLRSLVTETVKHEYKSLRSEYNLFYLEKIGGQCQENIANKALLKP